MRTFTIEYYYGSYEGERTITLADDDDRDPRDVMWKRLERDGYLTIGMASRGATVIDEKWSQDYAD